MIPVTKPFLPPLEEYKKYVESIWTRQWLTNMGPLASKLEGCLKEYLSVEELLFVTNGTVALQMAIKALELEGEIITTPFSFVATTSSIVWEGCTPVFVDIDPETLNIDSTKIEAAITKNTTGILATHVYGNPCDVVAIEAIARKYNLKVIYDGAHAFGVKINGESVFNFGDISTCSLHATKLYHSTEGGLIITNNTALASKMRYIRNFGISSHDSFSELGINGKNSEFHAAMGLVNLNYISEIHDRRKELTEYYDSGLTKLNAVKPKWYADATLNYAYYPLIMESEELLLKIKTELDSNNIFTRRYFYPSLATALPYLPKKELKFTDDISKRIMCLPLYFDLTKDEIDRMTKIMLTVQNS